MNRVFDWDSAQWDHASVGSVNGFAWDETDGEITIMEYWDNIVSKPPGQVVIPASIGKCPVVRIGFPEPAIGVFGDRSAASVVVPEGVRAIGGKAFSGCKGLEYVVIPCSVTEIEPSAFGQSQNQPYFHLRCFAGSYAEQFAKAHGIPYLVGNQIWQRK